MNLLCALVFVAGCGTWAICANGADPNRAWRSLLINFLYFFPMAIGMVVWPAVVRKSRGQWSAGVLDQTAFSAVTFAPVAIAMFILLFLGREHWAGWIHSASPTQRAWLSDPFVFIRDGGAMLLLLAVGALYVWRSYRRPRPPQFAGWVVFLYCIVLTLIAFDMVMSLDPQWYSALFGAYFFVSGAYLALAAWTLGALIRNPRMEVERRHDLGKLLVALGLLTMYMMYSQLIVIWYENLPKEVRFVIPRLDLAPWRWVSVVILTVIYLGPLVFLLPRWTKRSAPYLAAASVALLVTMWVERWWLVTPTLGGDKLAYGLPELSMTAACAAAMVFGMAWFVRRTQPARREDNA